LPSFKTEHHKAVEIAIELIKRSGISYDRFDFGLELPSFLIELDTVFESYVRNTIRSGLRELNTSLSVGDGNLSQWQKPLFDDTNRGLAKPDLLIKKSGAERPILVGDVKYKRDDKIGAADRYQVISHALAHQCALALIVSPARHNETSSMVRFGKIGGEHNGIDLYHFTMSMSSRLEDAEQLLVNEVHALL
jgi:5-methylcytosine-specific restriction enzyme subunit McrC